MAIEGIVLQSLPGGGSELTDAISDSKGLNKVLPFITFAFGIFLFMRIIVIPVIVKLQIFKTN